MSEAPAKKESVDAKGETAKETTEKENPPKTTWPELVGTKGETAKETIERENPAVEVEILDEDAPATFDYRFNRVQVWVDGNGMVVDTPSIG